MLGGTVLFPFDQQYHHDLERPLAFQVALDDLVKIMTHRHF